MKIAIIDDNDFYLKRLAIKIKTFIHQKNMENEFDLVTFNKKNINDYEKEEGIDIAIIDYSYLIPNFKKNGIDIAFEIHKKNPTAKIIINSAIDNAKRETIKFNSENATNFIHIDRSFEDIFLILGGELKK